MIMSQEGQGQLPQPVRTDSLASQAFTIIKDAIFTGQFQPGQLLRELHLARMLNVSQATIREALVQLEQVGLVVREQNRHTMVTNFTRDEVRDRLHIRVALEELAAVEASRSMGEAELAELSRLAEEAVQANSRGDGNESVRADVRFHELIWSHAGSPILAKMLSQLTTPLFAFLAVLHQAGMQNIQTRPPHEGIVKAMIAKDSESIRKLMRGHVENSYQDFLASDIQRMDGLVGKKAVPVEV